MDPKNLARRNAQQLAKEGHVLKAIEAFQETIASGAAVPYDYVYLGDLYIRADQHADAIVQYQEAIEAYTRLGFHRNAIALWRKILRLDSSRLDAYARMGDLYAAEQLVGDALHAYFAHLERASEKDRQRDTFQQVLKRVEELAPQRAEFAIRLSEFLVETDRLAAASAVLTRAAEIAQGAGTPDLAADLRERAQRIDPEAVGAEDSAAWGPSEVDELPEVAGDEIPAAALQPEPEPVQPLRYGEIELDFDADPTRFAKEPVDQDDFETHHQAIEQRLESGEAEEALALCDRLVQQPGLTAIHSAHGTYWRGQALSLLGRHDEAIAAMRLALQDGGTGPETARWAYTLALELETVGELDEARSLLHEAMERDPGFAEAADRLVQLERGAA